MNELLADEVPDMGKMITAEVKRRRDESEEEAAYNVDQNDPDVSLAKKISARIRLETA
jgi:hypothetical protein